MKKGKIISYPRAAEIAKVISVISLTEEEKRKIKEQLDKILGKNFVVQNIVDKEILGGLKIKLGSFILDNSLKGQLLRIKEALIKE